MSASVAKSLDNGLTQLAERHGTTYHILPDKSFITVRGVGDIVYYHSHNPPTIRVDRYDGGRASILQQAYDETAHKQSLSPEQKDTLVKLIQSWRFPSSANLDSTNCSTEMDQALEFRWVALKKYG